MTRKGGTALAVGLMSGTSLDGVDAALVELGPRDRVTLHTFCSEPYTPDERTRILDAIAGGTARELATLHVWLGERFATAVEHLLREAGITPAQLAFVASHGQTVWHEPGRASLQLGDPAVLAERFGVTVVSDFRSRDVAAGGQGAPLVPIADALLFGHPRHGRALLNIGGMANVTWVPQRGRTDGVVAFDTGPGVAVLDAVVRAVRPDLAYDEDGRLAAQGHPVPGVVDALLAGAFFRAPPPKSTGREAFGEAFAARLRERALAEQPAASPADLVATAVALTVRSIADQVTRWLPKDGERDFLVAGGGARNRTLMRQLAAGLPGWQVGLFADEFFDGDAKEAVAFAFVGWLTLEGRPGNVPSATGARGPRVLGRITPP
ncbi:MAG: anhydro-N-acetylmuramic acid kinase [Gemmatimonadetes bacterium]|nr:anhydro-N-acetylmuramic acid kinase [Gemmatimonadota bacterium]